MYCLGRVTHLDSRNLAILVSKKKVNKNTKIFDSEGKQVGRIVNVFGPVNKPYLAISANKGFRITRLIGREVYSK